MFGTGKKFNYSTIILLKGHLKITGLPPTLLYKTPAGGRYSVYCPVKIALIVLNKELNSKSVHCKKIIRLITSNKATPVLIG
jgi:hypothetical protein